MALLAHGLLPASFRGAPFAVLADEATGGRRVALHQYPGRDEPWAEDMGRAARTWRFRGFIVDGDVLFAGGPIQLQRLLLLAALEKSGPGVLTHPTLGVINASVTRFAIGQDTGAGRMSTVDVEFVEAGKQLFPALQSKSSGLLSAANLAKVALAADAVRVIALASGRGGTRRSLSVTAGGWTAQAGALGADATALHRLATQMPGKYGRFAGGGNDGLDGRTATVPTTLPALVAKASTAREDIASAQASVATVAASVDLGYAAPLVLAASALVGALSAACGDPADAIRLLIALLGFSPTRSEASTAIGAGFGRLVTRAAAAELVLAVGRYQPSSADDAAAMIKRVGEQLAMVAEAAADAGEDESFTAIRAARGAAVADLRARGATLARIRTFRPSQPTPALTLAQRFYRDPARAEQLVRQAQPVHPLFMPTAFRALAA